MQIQHNIAAAMAAAQQGIHASNFQKSAKKLGSGYRINSAADDAAQLSISEKMRTQIRGLDQSVNNAQDGANYVQIADGAMNEIHDMLHRMRELAVQSLNDTNTPQERAAMAMEMDKLQSEIDRIDTNTYYNTLPVFQEHEPSYYQIAGNRYWAANQQHAIAAPQNNLNIHLPAGYQPDIYTITVADGIYTTQELIDEIDDAFAEMKPSNPGFVFEYTEDGRCCVNFEGENGQPVKIDSVDGGLAYLIYDCFDGATTTSLLGTTAFQGEWPLKITDGKNDELMFEIEPVDGSPSRPATIRIPDGEYSRKEMIDLLNQKLSAYPGIKAAEYGENCIQITGGYDYNITGLKGNMFKLELGTEPVYTSVFYDNIRYGSSIETPVSVAGKAYYHPNYTKEIEINSTNNRLKFDYKGSSIEVPIPAGHYIIDHISNTSKNNLTFVLNEALKGIPGADIYITARSTGTDYQNGTYARYNYLAMTSESTGRDVTLKFDTSDPVCKKTYDTLFKITNYDFSKEATYNAGGKKVQITGSANLTGPVKIPDGKNTLSISVNNDPAFTITIPPRTYNSLTDLVQELNQQLPASQKGMIEFASSNNQLVIQPLAGANVDNLAFGNLDGAYEQLFVREIERTNYVHEDATGKEHYTQGATAPDIQQMASVTLSKDIPQGSTTINSQNNTIRFYLNDSYVSVTLADGTYSRNGLIDELNRNFKDKGYKVEASLTGNALTLTTTLTGYTRDLSLDVSTSDSYGNGWKAFVGTYLSKKGPDMPSESPNYLQGGNDFQTITLNSSNNNFVFVMADGNNTECNLTLAARTYTASELAAALQAAIDAKIGSGKISVSDNSSGIRMDAVSADGRFLNPADKNSGFYNAVFQKKVSGTHMQDPDLKPGTHYYDKAFIIGRYDITAGPVEIVSGINDKFVLDFTYKSNPSDPAKDFTKSLEATIPAGKYYGKQIAALLTLAFNAQLVINSIDGFELEATVGGHNTGVAGAIDSNALQITLHEKTMIRPDGTKETIDAENGTYILEGVRGNAASSLFYKISGKPEPSYVTGSQDISGGVVFPPDKNTLTLKADGKEYSYTFPKDYYNADEIAAFLNDKFEHGDDNGQTAPLVASLADGRLQIKHKVLGNHTISEVGGSAKGIVFYQESNRSNLDAFMLQVGALGHQGLELPRLRVGTAALKINSITISRPKYAEKALQRLDEALDLLSEKRSAYGALYNRIEHLAANNSNTSENTQASESRIRDTNMAAEMVEFLKQKLLTQVSDSVLAQANQIPDRLLNLLL